jgi:hypothetical protein
MDRTFTASDEVHLGIRARGRWQGQDTDWSTMDSSHPPKQHSQTFREAVQELHDHTHGIGTITM